MFQVPPPPVVRNIPPPPVVVPGGLPASICNGLPRAIQGQIQYCLFGLRLTGDLAALTDAATKLKSEGWDSTLHKSPTGEAVITVSAAGKTLGALQAVAQRIRRGELGALQMSVVAVPDPAQRR